MKPCVPLVKASSRVTSGSTVRRTTMRRVSHCTRPVYWSAKTNQAVGAITVPSQVTLSQKTTVDRSELPSVTTFPSDQRATPNMRRMKAVAPGAERRRHATSASQTDTATEIMSGITYGVNCQCITLLFSRLSVGLFGRILLHSVLLAAPGPVVQLFRFAE